VTSPPLRLCLATQNQHKVEELRALLLLYAPEFAAQLQVVSLAELGIHDEVIEDGADFGDNARIKARAAFLRSGLISLADDSGLQVDALGGAPGLYSARYGGEPRPGQSRDARNREKLLAELTKVAPADPAPAFARGFAARFVCVLCLYGPLGEGGAADAILRRGECTGRITLAERGSGGFGYDPLFVPDEQDLARAGIDPARQGLTFAELSSDEKNRLSHRTRALKALLPDLAARFVR
jgi:XTP/dITP diphosphohydrolase